MGIETCGGLTDPELMKLCVHLADKVQGLTIQPWITASIGIVGAVLAAYLSHRGSLRAQKTDRHSSSQRRALEAAQDLAHELRAKWIAYRSDPETFPDSEQTKLSGSLSLHLSRISGAAIVTAFESWSEYAQLFYTGFEQYQAYEEEDRWKTALKLSGDRLRKLD